MGLAHPCQPHAVRPIEYDRNQRRRIGKGSNISLSQNELNRYLERIGLSGPLPPSAETLSAIQWAHLQTVPFEALDICPLNKRFSLDLAETWHRVVNQYRGGFCFQLNSLLAAVLEALGYQLDRKAAWFTDDPEAIHVPLGHMTLNVTVPGDGSRWMVDVAAGRQNPPRSVPLNCVTADGQFRTRLEGGIWHCEKLGKDRAWLPQIAWDDEIRQLSDFEEPCVMFQVDPDSNFRKGPLCTIMTPNGRITLSKWTLITTANGVRTEQILANEDEVRAVLTDTFGISIDFTTWWEKN